MNRSTISMFTRWLLLRQVHVPIEQVGVRTSCSKMPSGGLWTVGFRTLYLLGGNNYTFPVTFILCSRAG